MAKKIIKTASAFLFVLIALALNVCFVLGAADFAITSFSCSPSESAINNVFSCTAQIKNNGDAAGTVSVATLYPDAGNWLENSNYPQASGTSVDPGQSTEVTFSGLRSVKSGNNGFSKIMLDSVTDTYVADNNIKVNIVNVVVTLSNSASSASQGLTFTSTAEVTAGGNIDVLLTFRVDSGGCSIGSQSSTETISSMQDGNKQARVWTVTEGRTGSCVYTISATATGAGGVAIKTDSTSSTVTCSDCASGSSITSSGGGGGAGGGLSVSKVYAIGELSSSQSVQLLVGEAVKFNISENDEHSVTLNNLTDTSVIIVVESKKQTFTLSVGDEKDVDLNGDGQSEINIKLKSINILSRKADLVISKISGTGAGGITGKAISEEEGSVGGLGGKVFSNIWIYFVIGIFVILAVVSIVYFIKRRRASSF